MYGYCSKLVKAENVKRCIAIFYLGIMAALMLNSTLFWHAHQLHDNSIIIHAHPFQKTGNLPYQEHHHTECELILIDQISHAVYYSPETTYFEKVEFSPIDMEIVPYHEHIPLNSFLSNIWLRGPPPNYIS
ncbi:MAG: hypothetical protein JJU28_04995 [Cyclobacteriaceae bacterium]|nr:hypothetical protein [Cyclobacteriaceae bacterium]